MSSDPAERTNKVSAVLANGRLAIMAIIGMFFQDGLTGSAWGDWDLHTASPLRAFVNELCVQDPVGFWDPLDFTKESDVRSFKRRSTGELKHGRISMLAKMGLSFACSSRMVSPARHGTTDLYAASPLRAF